MKLWLDDIRPAPSGWIWVKNADEFFDKLFNPAGDMTTEISLDHDLGEDELTGYQILNIIEEMIAKEEFPTVIPIFHIHSANPVGREIWQEQLIQSLVWFVHLPDEKSQQAMESNK